MSACGLISGYLFPSRRGSSHPAEGLVLRLRRTAPGLLALEVLFRSTLTMSVPKGLVRRDLELRGDGRTSASDGEDRQSMKTRTVVTEMAARRSPQKANLGSLDQSTSQAYTLCTHFPSCRITVRS